MEWTRDLIHDWKGGGVLSRGELYLRFEKMDIIIDESVYPALIEEFNQEKELSSKWALSILLMNIYKPAELFYHKYCDPRESPLKDEDMERIKPIAVSYFSLFFKSS
jgi:hypothetical protein